jgi:hypothetical protein
MRHRKVSESDFDLNMYPLCILTMRLTEMYVDCRRSGILPIETLADVDSDSEDSRGDDSKIDKNLESAS